MPGGIISPFSPQSLLRREFMSHSGQASVWTSVGPAYVPDFLTSVWSMDRSLLDYSGNPFGVCSVDRPVHKEGIVIELMMPHRKLRPCHSTGADWSARREAQTRLSHSLSISLSLYPSLSHAHTHTHTHDCRDWHAHRGLQTCGTRKGMYNRKRL